MKYLLLLTLTFSLNVQGLDWDTKQLDIKSKTSSNNLEKSFEFTNSTKKVVKFIRIKASCGCILVEAPERILPGKSGKITFKAPIPLGGGSYTKSIQVDTDETTQIEYILKFSVTNTDPHIVRKPKNTKSEITTKIVEKYIPPKEYIRPAKMNQRLLLIEKLKAKQAISRKKTYYDQEECPFLPLPINKNLYHDFEGMRIYTCCEQCLKLVKESPYHAIIKLAEKTQTPSLIKDIKLEENK